MTDERPLSDEDLSRVAQPPAAAGPGGGASGPEAPTADAPAAEGPAGGAPAAAGSVGGAPAAQPPAGMGRGRRWAIALAVSTLVVVLVGIVIGAFATGSSSSIVVRWAPADSLAYLEVRADLPGDQRAKLVEFASHFPGFADRSTFDAKADEVLDRLVRNATDGKRTFSADLKPWLGGELALAVTKLPAVTLGQPSGGADPGTGVLGIATVRDAAAARTWLASVTPAGASTETRAGASVVTWTTAGGIASGYALTGSVLLAGDPVAIRAALDRGPSAALLDVPAFRAALAQIPGDRLAMAWLDVRAIVRGSLAALPGASALLPTVGATGDLLANLPGWLVWDLRAEGAQLRFDQLVERSTGGAGASPVPATSGSPAVSAMTPRESSLAGHLPATTVVAIETHDLGATLSALLKAALASRASTGPGATLPGGLGDPNAILQGVESGLASLGDAGLVVTGDPSVGVGALVRTATPADADNAVTQLRNLVALAGSAAGITSRDEPYAGRTITLLDLGDLRDLIGKAASAGGAGASTPDLSRLPFPPGAHLELAVTSLDGLVVVGLGDGFVKAVLDTKPGAALADAASYRTAIEAAGRTNFSQAFVDLAGLRAILEPIIAASPNGATYHTEIRPYLEPLDALAAALTATDDAGRLRLIVSVK
jgi:hypothetical protein